MQRASALVFALAGLSLGLLVSLFSSPNQSVRAAASDRYQDFVICTGAVSINPRVQTDGVWLLDYRSGKLLGTVIDKTQGKIVGWAEVDLAAEFSVQPLQDVHFMMTTGYITQGQSALYVAETSTGKFGVYTMGPGANGSGVSIRRHDMTSFRTMAPAVQPAAANIPGMPGVAAAPVQGQPIATPPGTVQPPPQAQPHPSTTFPMPFQRLPEGALPQQLPQNPPSSAPPSALPPVNVPVVPVPTVPPPVNR